MKPGIPWSVKGIEPEAREAAKLAARKAGLTLGEWLNSVIFDQSAHIVGAQADSHPWENVVPSATLSPDPPRQVVAGRRPEPPVDHGDDSALRLQDIARQLSDLAQRERQTAPPPMTDRGRADRQDFERIVERLDETERQTVEALTAVNERLTLLSGQIKRLGRPAVPERPEDVPGYPALESALRSVIEHIEVSEKRTRDSLRAMQDRIAGLAERGTAPDGEELLRAAPVLAGLEGRLADMVNRIQRSEGLMTERIEGVRSTAQQMANQAQAAAVTGLRGELRELETRMLSSLKEAQAAAANAPSVVATEIARLHGDMAGLTRRLDDVKAGAASERDLQSLRGAIEQLSARVAQGPDLRPLADMDKRLVDINRRLEQAAVASRGDPQALRQLEDSIAAVAARVEQTERQLAHIGTMEQSIRQLHGLLEDTRGAAGDAAEAAATRALERYRPAPSADAAPSPELRALEDGLRAVRESASAAERRHQDTFEAMHATLAQIVAKLSRLEATSQGSAPPPGAEQNRGERPAVAEPRASNTMDAPAAQERLSGGDDFIAAARRAAQAAATRPSALRAEYDALTHAVAQKPAKLTLLQRLRGRSGGETPQAEPQSARRRLILAGLVLLVAASVFGYRSLSVPSLAPVQQSSRSEMPSRPATPAVTPSKSGPQLRPPDPIVTGSIVSRQQATGQALPPSQTGSEALRRAAADGDPRAQFVIAGRYLDGQGITQDFAQAFAWYRRAAASGLAPAQYRLATLYELGKGTAADPKQALAWYERAALAGNVKAMHNAAVLLAGDKAGPADFDRAFRWFKAAAERGFADSQYNLAIFYERGLGTPRNAEEAYVWYALSARQGDLDSRRRAAAIAEVLPAATLTGADLRLARWASTPVDDGANVVKVTDPAWNVGRPAGQS